MLLSSLDSYLPFHTSYSPSFTYTDSMERQEVSQQKRGLWTEEKDKILMDYIDLQGKGKWNRVAKMTGLKRCGKSCRLRWINYLSPNLKKGDFSEEEEDLIIRLHKLLGNRWSLIAGRVPGRTDNQVKNHWNTSLSKKLGIKKEKMKLGVKQEQPSMDDNKQEKTEEMSAAPNPKVPCCEDNGGIVAVNEGCHGVFETSYSMEPLPNESLEDSFWFSDENLSLYGTSSFMELPDVYSPDTFWDDM